MLYSQLTFLLVHYVHCAGFCKVETRCCLNAADHCRAADNHDHHDHHGCRPTGWLSLTLTTVATINQTVSKRIIDTIDGIDGIVSPLQTGKYYRGVSVAYFDIDSLSSLTDGYAVSPTDDDDSFPSTALLYAADCSCNTIILPCLSDSTNVALPSDSCSNVFAAL